MMRISTTFNFRNALVAGMVAEVWLLGGCAPSSQVDFSHWNSATENVGRAEVLVAGESNNAAPSFGAPGLLLFESDRAGNWDVWMQRLSDSGGAAVQQLTTDPGPDFAPSISPDGKAFTFISTRLAGTSAQYFLSRLGSPAATQIAPVEIPVVGGFRPGRFSSDGETIAYTSGAYIWTTNIRTGVRTQVVEGYEPNWIPRTDRLLFRRKAKVFGLFVTTSLWSARSDGSDLTEIIPGGERVSIGGASVSPDGTRLCFERWGVDRGRVSTRVQSDVFVANIDGTNQIQITTAPGWDGQCVWRDDRRIVFTSNRPVPGGPKRRHSSIWQLTLPPR